MSHLKEINGKSLTELTELYVKLKDDFHNKEKKIEEQDALLLEKSKKIRSLKDTLSKLRNNAKKDDVEFINQLSELKMKLKLSQTLNKDLENQVAKFSSELDELKLRNLAFESITKKEYSSQAIKRLQENYLQLKETFYKTFLNNQIKKNLINRLQQQQLNPSLFKEFNINFADDLQEKVNLIKLFKTTTSNEKTMLILKHIENVRGNLDTMKMCFCHFQRLESNFVNKIVSFVDKGKITRANLMSNHEEKVMIQFIDFLKRRLDRITADFKQQASDQLGFETSFYEMMALVNYIYDVNSFKAAKINELAKMDCFKENQVYPIDKAEAENIFLKITEFVWNYETIMELFRNFLREQNQLPSESSNEKIEDLDYRELK